MRSLADTPVAEPHQLDPLQLMMGTSGIVLVVLIALMTASFAVWVIWLLKTLQVMRLRSLNHEFEREAEAVVNAQDLISLALRYEAAPGGRVVLELAKRHHQQNLSAELLQAVARRAIVTEEQRASRLMPTLASIASASPFVGLFGTVWGILNALTSIGVAGQASIDKVAGPVGEALQMTAIGLAVAVPAVLGYNWLLGRNKRLMEMARYFTSDLHAFLVSGSRVQQTPAVGGRPIAAAPRAR